MLPKGVILRGRKLYVRYRSPQAGKWVTKATGLDSSQVTEAVRIRNELVTGKQVTPSQPDWPPSESEINQALARIAVTDKPVTSQSVMAPDVTGLALRLVTLLRMGDRVGARRLARDIVDALR